MSGFLPNTGGGGGGGGFTPGGDLSGNSTSQNVINIHGASVPIAGALTTGNILQVIGASALGYAPLNVGGGSNFITGILPVANQAAQAGSTLTGTSLASGIINSSLTSVGTLTNLTVTNPISGSITGNSATASAVPASGITGTILASNVVSSSLTSVGTLTNLTVTNPISGSITGNAATSSSTPANGITGTTLSSNVVSSSLTSVGTLINLTVTNPISGSITGNAATSTTSSAVPASGITGATLASNVVSSSLTSVGTLVNLTVTNPISGSITGNAATSTTASAVPASGITGTTLASNVVSSSLTSVGTLTSLTVTNPISGSITGNAATASAVAANNITGTTLASNVVSSSLTSVGTLTNLTVTNPISGSITGNAATVTTNANLTGDVTSVGNTTTLVKITGSSPILITPAGLQWLTATTSPTISQQDNTTASATAQSLTIQSQNATGTTATGGNLVLASGTGTTAAGSVQFKVGSTVVSQLASTTSDFITVGSQAATVGGIRLGNNIGINARNTTNTTDFALLNFSASNNVIVGNNISSIAQLGSGTTVQFAIAGTSALSITSTETLISTPPLLSFGPALTNPKIRQQDNTTNSSVGQSFIIQAQNATGTTAIGGDGYFTSGTGTTSAGALHLQVGGADVVRLAGNATDFLKLGSSTSSAGTIRLGNTSTITARNGANSADLNLITTDGANNIVFGSASGNTYVDANAGIAIRPSGGVLSITLASTSLSASNLLASYTISQVSTATASATGSPFTVQAQNATGTTSTGGALILASGTGTTSPGAIQHKVGTTVVLQQGMATTDLMSFGAIPSSTGIIRLSNSNSSPITFRNSGNTADVPVISIDVGNNIVFGDATQGTGFFMRAVSLMAFQVASAAVNRMTLSSTVLTLNISSFQWTTGTTAPVINQADNTTASATAQPFVIQAQNATGTTATGGILNLTSGTGTTAAGVVNIQAGGTSIAKVDSNKLYALKGMSRSITDIVASYTVLATDYIIAVGTLSTAITITLPASPNNGDTYIVKDKIGQGGTNAITISGNGHNIDGAATAVINTNNFTSVSLTYNTASTRWMIT